VLGLDRHQKEKFVRGGISECKWRGRSLGVDCGVVACQRGGFIEWGLYGGGSGATQFVVSTESFQRGVTQSGKWAGERVLR